MDAPALAEEIASVTEIYDSPLSTWRGQGSFDAEAQLRVESGGVLHCPDLSFEIRAEERQLFDATLSDAKRKSIYLRGTQDDVLGSTARGEQRQMLQHLLTRYRDDAMALATVLFPNYRGLMQPASTSFRPRPTGVGKQSLSWRKDDTRLHVDAFPSNPTHGMRILRVFSNVGTGPRVWRVGEPFTAMALRFLPKAPEYSPWRAKLLAWLGITKRRRSPYDHFMLHLHDGAKADLLYQQQSPQRQVDFAPGSTWICYSDQVMHAAMAGQFMMEQTIHVPLEAMAHPDQSPLAILERLTASELLAEPNPAPSYY